MGEITELPIDLIPIDQLLIITQDQRMLLEKFKVNVPAQSLLLDVYTIARIFRTFPGKKHIKSNKQIVYTGARHTMTIAEFFRQLDAKIKMYPHDFDLNLSLEKPLRCVIIPPIEFF